MIAGHRITRTIERGRSEAVFAAEAPDGTPVVLRLVEMSGGGRAALGRAERLGELSHPALPQVTGFGEEPEGIWVATAAVEGITLRALIDQGIAPMRAVRLVGEVADGIDAAHRAGFSHGDVRAENVIVRGRPVERAVLTGFRVKPGGARPIDDVKGLETLLHECAPNARPVAAAAGGATARGLVAGAAQALLRAEPSQPTAEGRDDDEQAPSPWAKPWAKPKPEPAKPKPEPAEQPAKPKPEPAKPRPKPAKPERRLSPGWVKAAGAALVIAAAAAAGYAVSDPSQSGTPARPGSASADPVTVAVPRGWETTGPGRALRQLEDGVVLTASHRRARSPRAWRRMARPCWTRRRSSRTSRAGRPSPARSGWENSRRCVSTASRARGRPCSTWPPPRRGLPRSRVREARSTSRAR